MLETQVLAVITLPSSGVVGLDGVVGGGGDNDIDELSVGEPELWRRLLSVWLVALVSLCQYIIIKSMM